MRRGVGVGAIKRKQENETKAKDVGREMETLKMEHIESQLVIFQESLRTFAMKHKNEINKNPQFRRQFQIMCSKIGVDPLASSKGFWADILGFGDFYYELGIQIIDVAYSTREMNGGLINFTDLHRRLIKMRGNKGTTVEEDDIKRSIDTIRQLGNGYSVINVGLNKVLVTVPIELSSDHSSLLNLAQSEGKAINSKLVMKKLGWDAERVRRSLEMLLKESMCWIDDQEKDGPSFYFPSFFFSK